MYFHLYSKIGHFFHIPQFWRKHFVGYLKSQTSKFPTSQVNKKTVGGPGKTEGALKYPQRVSNNYKNTHIEGQDFLLIIERPHSFIFKSFRQLDAFGVEWFQTPKYILLFVRYSYLCCMKTVRVVNTKYGRVFNL